MAETERVTFTRPAAQRISRAVRIVEGGERDTKALQFARTGDGGRSGSVFRICTFTGAWSIDTAKVVTLRNQTTTPNTLSATNLFFPLDEIDGEFVCAVAKDRGDWYLLQVKHTTDQLIYYPRLEQDQLEFDRRTILTPATANATTVAVSVVTCATAAS